MSNSAAFLKAFPLFSRETVAEVSRRGLLSFRDGCWRFGDASNGSKRRLDGRKFRLKNGEEAKAFADNSGSDWHRLIGLVDVVERDRRWVIFVIEGSKDAMAAFEFAKRAGVLHLVGVVVALGSGYRPISSELAQLVGRKVIVIGDRDGGVACVRILSAALCKHGVKHVVLNWNAFLGGKDLFDLLEIGDGDPVVCVLSNFFSFSSPSFCTPLTSSVLPLYSVHPLYSSVLSISQFICTANGQRNRKLLELARATKGIEEAREKQFSVPELSRIFDAWHVPSAPFIRMSCDECLLHFIDLLRHKVRFPMGAKVFEEAARRAESMPLPDIGVECVPLQKIAALCRELQRPQPGHPFFLSVRTAQAFAGFASESAAYNALRTLETMKIIECVKRGIPGHPGNPATGWRYLLPLSPKE
jgi:hypothetical protein